MKADIELDFSNEQEARNAFKVLWFEEQSERSRISVRQEKYSLKFEISSSDFSLLRARINSLMREARIVYDCIEVSKGE